jgi:hypothetical protein
VATSRRSLSAPAASSAAASASPSASERDDYSSYDQQSSASGSSEVECTILESDGLKRAQKDKIMAAARRSVGPMVQAMGGRCALVAVEIALVRVRDLISALYADQSLGSGLVLESSSTSSSSSSSLSSSSSSLSSASSSSSLSSVASAARYTKVRQLIQNLDKGARARDGSGFVPSHAAAKLQALADFLHAHSVRNRNSGGSGAVDVVLVYAVADARADVYMCGGAVA